MEEEIEALVALMAMAERSPLVATLLLGFAAVVGLYLFWKVAAVLVELLDKFTSLLNVLIARIRGGREQSEWLTRKKQFLGTLQADLTAIGRAEAWNDQQFTDLEAEVEIEGAYYSSVLSRLIRRKSSGLRREPSLVRAIYGSSERCLLLIGEPGAGKSVALRHLASQMITRSVRSNDPLSPVPLYINLREFQVPAGVSVTVDIVRSFVLENVRRGDADIGDYVQEHWAEFQSRGIWFFLFDSFDEIPAVLHAATSEAVVNEYARAIQQFMDGLGSCRGVLASREFKSPTLAWARLRILPMSEPKQEELVRRSFLNREQKETAIRAISLSNSATYANPLFLSLLCRYVRSNLLAPANEHELLYTHVQALAARDAEYVERKWGFAEKELLAGASELARLFAESPDLGLAPTIVELRTVCQARGESFLEGNLDRLVEALVYVKVGRNDVGSADRQVRRFAFAHRRYQECLFAAYLAENVDAVPIRELLTDARWRDYLVALLQISEPTRRRAIVEQARRVIADRVSRVHTVRRKFLGVELSTWDWEDGELAHVLAVFLEAKRYWPDGPWGVLAPECEKLLGPLWAKGDYQDRRKVLEFCGVGDEGQLANRLSFGIFSGVPVMEEAAVDAAQFLLRPSLQFSSRVRASLVARMLTANKRFELLRWEAIASELPPTYQMDNCVRRAKSLASHGAIARAMLATFEALDRVFAIGVAKMVVQSHRSELGRKISTLGLMSLGAIWGIGIFVSILVTLAFAREFTSLHAVLALVAGGGALYLLVYVIRLECVAVPSRLTIPVIFEYVTNRGSKAIRSIPFFLGFAALAGAPGALVVLIAKLVGVKLDAFDLMVGGSTLFYLVVMLWIWLAMAKRARDLCERAAAAYATAPSAQKAIGALRTNNDILAMSQEIAKRCKDERELRRVISYLSALKRAAQAKGAQVWVKSVRPYYLRASISNVLSALDLAQRETRLLDVSDGAGIRGKAGVALNRATG